MPLEQQVSSIALSQRLKELGVSQKVTHGDFAFIQDELHLVHNDNDTGWLLGDDYSTRFDWETGMYTGQHEWCKSFTVAELGEILKKASNVDLHVAFMEVTGGVTSRTETVRLMLDIETLTKMLIHLIENNLITL